MQRRRTLQPLPLPPRPPARISAGAESAGSAGAIPEVIADELADIRSYERGTTVLPQGSDGGRIFVVREGLVREAAVSPDGRWFVHALLGPGEVFGTLAPSMPTPAAVRTVRRTTLSGVSAEGLGELLAKRPEVARWLIAAIERRAVRAQRTVHDLAWCDVTARLRRRLLALAREHGHPIACGIRLEIPITQEDLGAMIGATRETVNRSLVALIASGRIRVDRRRYVILDAFARSLADDDPIAP